MLSSSCQSCEIDHVTRTKRTEPTGPGRMACTPRGRRPGSPDQRAPLLHLPAFVLEPIPVHAAREPLRLQHHLVTPRGARALDEPPHDAARDVVKDQRHVSRPREAELEPR